MPEPTATQQWRTEWALRAAGGTSRVLMMRTCDENGKDYQGHDVAWRDIATFPKYTTAERVLAILQASSSGRT